MTETLSLDFEAMDALHDDFLLLLERVKGADGAVFFEAFEALILHTESHFDREEALMRSHDFHAIREHLDEHKTLLDEMRYFYEKGKRMPPFAQNYINEYAFEKFRRHVINIDSQLAAFLKEKTHG